MKIQIRRGVFETNSSSVHSITVCSQDDYDKWIKGDMVYDSIENILISKEQCIETYCPDINPADQDSINEALLEEGLETFEKYHDDDLGFDFFKKDFTTPNGEKIKVFGYYGWS